MDLKKVIEDSVKYDRSGCPKGEIIRISETEALYYEYGSAIGQRISLDGDSVRVYGQDGSLKEFGEYNSYSDSVRMTSVETGLATREIGESDDVLYSNRIGSWGGSSYISNSGYNFNNYEEEELNYELYGNYDGYEDDDDY